MPHNKPKLVLVDDDPAIVRLLEHLIAQHLSDAFAMVSFTDPRAACEWIGRHGCQVLVSDVEMPSIGGIELLRAVQPENPGMQAIFLTAHSSWERITEAIEHGVNDYLLKPIDHAELIALLRQKHEALRGAAPSATSARALVDEDAELSFPADDVEGIWHGCCDYRSR